MAEQGQVEAWPWPFSFLRKLVVCRAFSPQKRARSWRHIKANV